MNITDATFPKVMITNDTHKVVQQCHFADLETNDIARDAVIGVYGKNAISMLNSGEELYFQPFNTKIVAVK